MKSIIRTMILKKSFLLLLISTFFIYETAISQDVLGKKTSDEYNVITTAVPFLTIAPDSRAGAMGDVGAATSTDVWSMHWNPAKYAFAEDDLSVGISVTPWLRNLGIKDINLYKLAGYYKLNDMQTIAASVLYFSLGDITFTDDTGNEIPTTFEPSEFFVDLAYSRLLADYFSLGIAGRFIYSNLIGSIDPDSRAGISVAADISGMYSNEIAVFGSKPKLNIGFNISNLGSKISYTDGGEKDFIPTNLKLGLGVEGDIDEYNSIGFYMDANKLLVPSENDGADVGMVTGVFQSFTDAPGGGAEELHEITYAMGVEYWYDKQFSVRGGYFTEHKTKGNRKFFSLGVGVRLNVFGLDVSYLIPTNGNSPLANTLRFSLVFDFEGLKNENKENNSKAINAGNTM